MYNVIRGNIGNIYFGRVYHGQEEKDILFNQLKELNIKYICNLLPESYTIEEEKEYFNVIELPIEDYYIPENKEEFIKTIDRIIKLEDKIYIHCYGGHGRTGLTVASIMVRLGETTEKALKYTRELPPLKSGWLPASTI